MKETQGSVEVTSYSQMDNIFEYGCYIVGVKQPAIGECHDDVIYLQLKEEGLDRCLTKKKYNLEELRDLESKLVLITGSKTENRRKVELFVNVRKGLRVYSCIYSMDMHCCHTTGFRKPVLYNYASATACSPHTEKIKLFIVIFYLRSAYCNIL